MCRVDNSMYKHQQQRMRAQYAHAVRIITTRTTPTPHAHPGGCARHHPPHPFDHTYMQASVECPPLLRSFPSSFLKCLQLWVCHGPNHSGLWEHIHRPHHIPHHTTARRKPTAPIGDLAKQIHGIWGRGFFMCVEEEKGEVGCFSLVGVVLGPLHHWGGCAEGRTGGWGGCGGVGVDVL